MSKRQMQEEHEEHSNNRVVANSLRETLVSLVLANVVFASKLGSESHELRETEARQRCYNVAGKGNPDAPTWRMNEVYGTPCAKEAVDTAGDLALNF